MPDLHKGVAGDGQLPQHDASITEHSHSCELCRTNHPNREIHADSHCHVSALRHTAGGGAYLINTIDLDDIPAVEAAHDAYSWKRERNETGGDLPKTLRFGFGVHPMSVWKYPDVRTAIARVREALLARVETRLAFVGEVGLDYRPAVLAKWDTPQQGVESQLLALREQVRLAFALCVPIELHVVNRKPGCWESVCAVLAEEMRGYGADCKRGCGDPVPPPIVVLHSFSGSWGTYQQIHSALSGAWREARRACAARSTESVGTAGNAESRGKEVDRECQHSVEAEDRRLCRSPAPRLYLSVSHLTDGCKQTEKAISRLWEEDPRLLLLETDHTGDEECYSLLWTQASEVLAGCAQVPVAVAQQRAAENLLDLISVSLPGPARSPTPEPN